MLVFHELSEFTAWRNGLGPTSTVGLVPTMGALHSGHASLIRDCASSVDETVVSIFVNKIQFTNQSDFTHYPRTLEADLQLAKDSGATAVLVPSDDAMRPLLETHPLKAGPIGTMWEGRDRPGHFDGVLTVVNQLFALVRPTRARFGEKDRQQLVIITNWVQQSWPHVVIDRGPTVRDSDGLALSSRNVRLSVQGRSEATSIPHSLRTVVLAFSSGTTAATELMAIGRMHLSPKLDVHYLTVVDGASLLSVDFAEKGSVVLLAASIDGVRLLDNIELV